MPTNKSFAGVHHIFCPTDLTSRSQRALAFAGQIAGSSGARLTAFHSTGDSWLHQSATDAREVKRSVSEQIREGFAADTDNFDLDVIVEKGSKPASVITGFVRDLNVDLVVMKARPGISSALHFGSIVERVISGVQCPVLLLPDAFLAKNDPVHNKLDFKQILFDYDFSQATDELFHLTNALTRSYHSELHVLSILEPPNVLGVDFAQLENSKLQLKSAIRNRVSSAIVHEGRSPSDVSTTVEWGSHTEKILNYARTHEIDLICTALPAPSHFFEKLYRLYLGQLLASAVCPVLVKQCI